MDKLFLVFNKHEWLVIQWFSQEEIDNADGKGFIGSKYGVDCYLTKPIESK